ncbi:MAG: YbaN family protein [Melioribacteraceae bacterium]|nr:YbaN family protein [Melioribacteraceae bacterium]MCF8264696.1 YbaN family protein [Melioribacteraceae bacterium]MCF8412236.1 YbaN family protein [Melioribacteraceae bacterium]MCF8431118.1 YbaN family protein [Melioribacteraceae bacterium]
MKYLLIFLGTLSLGIGIIGIIVPGLPTTVFLLITAACYFRSSERLYNWLIHHKVYGKFIRDYREHKAMPRKAKISALIMMWAMISLSTIFFIKIMWVQIVVVVCGLIGTIVILSVKTLKYEME